MPGLFRRTAITRGRFPMHFRFPLALLLTAACAATAGAGTVFEFETKELDGPEPILGTVQMSTAGSNTRLEIISVSSDEAGGLIFHGGRKEMIILDHLQGHFITMNQEQINDMAAEVDSALSQMRDSLEDMSPEERALAEQTMEQQYRTTEAAEAPPPVVRNLGSHGEVAGVPCRNFEILANGRKVRELCVSRWQDLEGGQETAAALRGVVEFFESMRQAFAGSDAMEVFDRQQELFGLMGDLDGYPVLYRDFTPGGRMIRETRLTAARQRDIGADFFNPPPGYQREELPQGMN